MGWRDAPLVDSGPEPTIPGNIDLGKRPRVRNADGSVSTVRSIGVNMDGREYLIPTVSDDGRIMSEDEAIQTFRRTGKHLGAYRSVADSNAAAKRLHDDQETMVAFDGMRPMVAHTPRSAAPKWQSAPLVDDKGTLDEELRTPPIGIDPRLEPESMMNEAQAAEVPGDVAGAYGNYTAMATAPTMMRGGQAIVTGALRSRLGPMIRGAAVGGGTAYLAGGDVRSGMVSGALIGAAGGSGAAPASVAKEATQDAAELLKVARSAESTPAARIAARAALQKMGWVPEAAAAAETSAETAAPTVRKLAPIPDKGKVKLPTVYSPTPVQGPKPLTEMQIVTRGRQEEAAKAAGLDIKEVFGSKNLPPAVARHKALMAFGKEAAKRNPKVGEKIWMLLDESGNPVKELTPGEAGAAARKGLKTTWVKNLWTN